MSNIITKEGSDLLKWFCSIAVLIGHTLQYSNNPSMINLAFIPPFDYFIGSICVSVFLFCSGYGLSISYKKNERYLISMGGRIKKIIFPFLFVVIIYQVVSLIFNNTPYLLIDTFYKLFEYTDYILPFSWYIYLQITLYVIFYISFQFVKKSYGLLILIFLCGALIIILKVLQVPNYWIISIPSFVLGTIICFAEYVNKYVIRVCIGILMLIGVINTIIGVNIPIVNYSIISFMIVYIFGRLIKHSTNFSKRILLIADSYFIYLVQGFFIKLLHYEHTTTYVVCSIIGSLILAIIFNYTYKYASKFIVQTVNKLDFNNK